MNARHLVLVILAIAALNTVAQDAAPTLEEAFRNLPAYSMGGDSTGLETIRAEVNRSHTDPAAREALEARLVAVLGAEATPDAKLFCCRQLFIIGTARAIPALTALLADPATADEARYALERMECAEAGVALRAALDALSGNARIGVINSIGIRGEAEAVPALAALIGEDEPDTAQSAVEALSRIGDVAACEVLCAHLDDGCEPVKTACEDGVLECAERLVASGALDEAAALYERLCDPQRRDAVRVAAYRGMVLARPDDRVALVKSGLVGDDAPMTLAAFRFIRSGDIPVEVAAGWLRNLPADRKPHMIDALADSADAAAVPAIVEAVRHPEDDATLHAALQALGTLGDRTVIPVLARTAAESDGETAELARDSLARLKGDDINGVMMTAARAGNDDVKKVLIQALGARHASEVSSELIATFAKNSGSPEVQDEALRALAKTAEPEQLDDLVSVLVRARKGEVQNEAQRAVVATALRAEGGDKTAAILKALPTAKKPYSRAALVAALGDIGDPSGIEAIRAALTDSEVEVRGAAVRALGEWPSEEVMNDLARLSASAEQESWGDTAFQGYVRLIRATTERDTAATVELYRNALQLATGPARVKMVLAGLGEVPDLAALELLRPHLENPEVSAEARIAYDRVRRSLFVATASHNTDKAANALDNDPRTRWDAGVIQAPGQWFQVDLTEPSTITRIVLDSSRSASDFPRAYDVYISMDPENWGSPVVSGQGTDGVTTIEVPNVAGRYVRIVQTGSSTGNLWSIHELMIETY